jgi:hypothetical protein
MLFQTRFSFVPTTAMITDHEIYCHQTERTIKLMFCLLPFRVKKGCLGAELAFPRSIEVHYRFSAAYWTISENMKRLETHSKSKIIIDVLPAISARFLVLA